MTVAIGRIRRGLRVGLRLGDVSSVRRQRPNDGHRNRDEDNRPHRRVGQPRKRSDHPKNGNPHADDTSPYGTAEEVDTRQKHDDAEDKVDPTPRRRGELKDVFLGHCVEMGLFGFQRGVMVASRSQLGRPA